MLEQVGWDAGSSPRRHAEKLGFKVPPAPPPSRPLVASDEQHVLVYKMAKEKGKEEKPLEPPSAQGSAGAGW